MVFDQIGSPTYAGDLAGAVVRIVASSARINPATKGKNWEENIYHYSNEGVCSWYDLAYETIKLAGKDGQKVLKICANAKSSRYK